MKIEITSKINLALLMPSLIPLYLLVSHDGATLTVTNQDGTEPSESDTASVLMLVDAATERV